MCQICEQSLAWVLGFVRVYTIDNRIKGKIPFHYCKIVIKAHLSKTGKAVDIVKGCLDHLGGNVLHKPACKLFYRLPIGVLMITGRICGSTLFLGNHSHDQPF